MVAIALFFVKVDHAPYELRTFKEKEIINARPGRSRVNFNGIRIFVKPLHTL